MFELRTARISRAAISPDKTQTGLRGFGPAAAVLVTDVVFVSERRTARGSSLGAMSFRAAQAQL